MHFKRIMKPLSRCAKLYIYCQHPKKIECGRSYTLLLKESSRWKPFPFKSQTVSQVVWLDLLFLMKEQMEIAGGG